MKFSIFTKLLSCLLAILMIVPATMTAYAAEASGGKYVKDVFIAYGEDKAKAEEWLRQNGWEPKFDLNDGKTSKAAGFHTAVAVLGIKRTNDPKEAITDMATMFMNGGYSFDDYEGLVKEKKADLRRSRKREESRHRRIHQHLRSRAGGIPRQLQRQGKRGRQKTRSDRARHTQQILRRRSERPICRQRHRKTARRPASEQDEDRDR